MAPPAEGAAPHTSEAVGAPPAVEAVKQAAQEQLIDPYNVSGGIDEEGNIKAIDYEALRLRFDTPALTEEHLARFERVTGKPPHRLMRRKLFFSHRDFDKILDYYEKHKFFLLYTGRGPSSGSMHLGHAVPFLFTKELQDIFDVPLVVMLTDDEKFLYTRNKNQGKAVKGSAVGDFIKYAHDNCKDIIALGFDAKKTFIYTDYEYMGGHFYQNISEFEALLTNNQIRGALGFDGRYGSRTLSQPISSSIRRRDLVHPSCCLTCLTTSRTDIHVQHKHRPQRLRSKTMRSSIRLVLPNHLLATRLPPTPLRRPPPSSSYCRHPDPNSLRHRPRALLPNAPRKLRQNGAPISQDRPHPFQIPHCATRAWWQDECFGSE